MKKLYTLCIIHNDTHVLLGMKKRGFGEGRWNGFGGKPHDGESLHDALKRELKEEAGIELGDSAKRGVLTFEFEGNPVPLEVHVFSASDFEGEPTETEEMKPQWFRKNALPFNTMWPDDKHWFPLLLNGKNFRGSFFFKDNNTLMNHHLEEL